MVRVVFSVKRVDCLTMCLRKAQTGMCVSQVFLAFKKKKKVYQYGCFSANDPIYISISMKTLNTTYFLLCADLGSSWYTNLQSPPVGNGDHQEYNAPGYMIILI